MKRLVRGQLKLLKLLDLVLIEWVDAENTPKDGGWMDIHSILPKKTTRVVIARTVGFYIGHSKTLICTTANYDPSNQCVYGLDDIPLSAIQTIVRLEVRDDSIPDRVLPDDVGGIQCKGD
jgi:hypothetical protein